MVFTLGSLCDPPRLCCVVQVPEVVEYDRVMKQTAAQDPAAVVRSPGRTASIRASSMPRLAVADPQVATGRRGGGSMV